MSYADLKHDYLQKLSDEYELRGFSRRTFESYSFHVSKFLDFLDKTGFNLSHFSVKRYILSLDVNVNTSRLVHASIKFFFSEVLKRPFSSEEIPSKKKEKKLPRVLSKEQIKKMIVVADNLKHRLIIKMLYSTGIRLQELVDLRRKDIYFDRNIVFDNYF